MKRAIRIIIFFLGVYHLGYSVPIRLILNNNTDANLTITAQCEATGSRPLAIISLPSTQKNMIQFDSQGQCRIDAIFKNNPYDRPTYQGALGLNIERETTLYGEYNLIWTRGGVRPPGTEAFQPQWEIDYTINKKR